MKPSEDTELMQITNLVMKNTNAALISMLENSIKIAKNGREKKAYQNVITWVRVQDKQRVDKIEPLCKPKSAIIQPELIVVKK